MSSQRIDVIRGIEPVGGQQQGKPGRRFEILAKDFTTVDQQAPIRLIYGRARVAGVRVTPIFGFRNEEVVTKQGK